MDTPQNTMHKKKSKHKCIEQIESKNKEEKK
jgi:hypothetical protein